MLKKIAVLAAALWLTGCGIPEYFDQHPANVRDVSADDSDNVTPKRNATVAQTPLPTVVQLEAPVPAAPSPVVAPVPPQPPATSRSDASVAPLQSPVAAAEEAPTAVPPPPIVTQAPAQPSGPAPQGEAAQSVPPVDVPVATTPPQEAAPQEAPPEQPAPQGSPAEPASTRPTIHAYCETLAVQRAADAAANGYDDDTQQAVHDGSYKKCVIWETAHGGPN